MEIKIQNYRFLISFIVIAILGSWTVLAAEDIVIADFEGGKYPEGWQIDGNAFGSAPAKGAMPEQQRISGFTGSGLVNTYLQRDDSQGTITSPSFKIERNYINFLVGGGEDFTNVGIRLIHHGKPVRKASGENRERLDPFHWDVQDLKGQTVTLEIYDNYSGSWGHINVDEIVQSDKPKGRLHRLMTIQNRDLKITGNLLLLPICNRNAPKELSIAVGEKLVHSLEGNFAYDAQNVDWWAYLDLEDYKGMSATITVKTAVDSELLTLIESSDQRRDIIPIYTEKLRPQLRFSQMQGWNNDPNGMVYYDGEYHFFWQCNPVGLGWGNMYWGHAVSEDLVHWKELPRALRPNGSKNQDRDPSMADGQCWSGGATIDFNNTLGVQQGNTKTLIATFTDTSAGERLAYSTDKGRTWKVDKVLFRHSGRDPKPFWHEPSKHWNIIAWSGDDREREKFNLPKIGNGGHAIYKSKDFKTWEQSGFINNYFECPEMFELPVDGDEKNTRWIVFGAASIYRIGKFDGSNFTADEPDAPDKKAFYGPVYAAQLFSGTPDDRKIYIAWTKVNISDSQSPYSQGFTLPLNLTLRTTDDGLRLFANPVEEFKQLRKDKIADWSRQTITPKAQEIKCEVPDTIAEVELSFEASGAPEGIELYYGANSIRWNFKQEGVNGITAKLNGNKGSLRLLIDRPFAEMFVNYGAAYNLIPRQRNGRGAAGESIDNITIKLIGKEGKVAITEGAVYKLKSIWQ